LTSACTEPDGVAFTPPGTAGRSTDASAGGFCSPSGGGGTADLGSSGIAANAQISGWKGNGENVNFYQLEDYGVNEHADNAAIPQPRGCEDRSPSVLLDLGVGGMVEEIRMTF